MLSHLETSLRKFATQVISRARTNLTKNKKNGSKKLYDSLGYKFNETPNGFSLSFVMEKYGMFQDKGVHGTDSSYLSAKGSPFRYRESSNLIGVEYHTGTFAAFAKRKGMQPRSAKGRFGSYKTMGFILAQSIKKKGIKPSMFFTKPFEAAFKSLDEDIIEAYQLDLKDFFQFTTKN